MLTKEALHKQLTLLCLYIAQTVPMSFFSSVVPVIMREEAYSLESIGMLQFIKLPWILKLFWAPLVDNKSLVLNDYKRWIIQSEIFYAVIILIISFLSLETNFLLILVLMVVAITASATQDIASDALSVRIIDKKHHGFGASMQSMGGFIGSLIGSGVLLIVYHRLGWNSLLLGLAGFVLVALIPLLLYRQKLKEPELNEKPKKISLSGLVTFFKQKRISRQVLFFILYQSGILSLLAMLRPYLVDLSYSKEEIGLLMGVIGTLTATLSSLLAGFLIRRYGRRKCSKIISLIILLATMFVLWVSLNHQTPVYIYSCILFIWMSYGMATVVVYTTAMSLVRERQEGTDFTLLTVLVHLSGMVLAGLSGVVAEHFSYSWLFLLGAILSTLSFLYNLFFHKY